MRPANKYFNPPISTKALLAQTKDLIRSGYDPKAYLDLWLVGDVLATPKDPVQGDILLWKEAA